MIAAARDGRIHGGRAALVLLGAIATSFPVAADADRRLDALIVYGDHFSFSVKEPPGWTGDIDHAAAFGANVVFRRSTETAEGARALIRVRIDEKVDEDTAKDLDADMDGYRRQYRRVEFKPLTVSHPQYRTFAKVFQVPGQFYEYVVYLNPGAKVPFLFSVSMNRQQTPATAEEVAVFRRVASSLAFLTTNVKQ